MRDAQQERELQKRIQEYLGWTLKPTPQGDNYSFFIENSEGVCTGIIKLDKREKLEREQIALSHYRRNGIPVPESFIFHERCQPFGLPFSIVSYVPHRAINATPHDLGTILAQIHALPETEDTNLPEQHVELIARIQAKREALVPVVGETFVERELQNAQRQRPRKNYVLHRDLGANNVLCGSDGKWYVIDPNPVRGDVLFDVAYTLRMFRTPQERSEFLAAYAPQGLTEKEERELATYERCVTVHKLGVVLAKLQFLNGHEGAKARLLERKERYLTELS